MSSSKQTTSKRLRLTKETKKNVKVYHEVFFNGTVNNILQFLKINEICKTFVPICRTIDNDTKNRDWSSTVIRRCIEHDYGQIFKNKIVQRIIKQSKIRDLPFDLIQFFYKHFLKKYYEICDEIQEKPTIDNFLILHTFE